jgi:hypothetical protein
MTTKIQTGTKINGKYGNGTITRILTKSTGYVEVTWENGRTTKEMAFNLSDENGNLLKPKPQGSGLTKRQKDARAIKEFEKLSNLKKLQNLLEFIFNKVIMDYSSYFRFI